MTLLRIKENNREKNKAWMEHCVRSNPRGHAQFMREFAAGKFLSWFRIPTEGNHGPGPSHTWYTSTALPTTTFPSREEALEFWGKHTVGDVVVECVQVTLERG